MEYKKYQEIFAILKVKFSIFSILRPLNCSLSFYVLCDALFVDIKSTLYEISKKKGKDYPIAFSNR